MNGQDEARALAADTLSLPRQRRTKVDRIEDPLPERALYQDSGCEVAPACLRCPLPVCRYELAGGLMAARLWLRDRAIQAQRRRGATVAQLSRQFGMSPRSVYRVLAARTQGEE